MDPQTPPVGHTAEPFRMVVEEGKVREFAVATHAVLDESTRPLRSTPTFLAASALWMRPENSVWHGIERDYRRVLHGEQEFTFPAGPPAVGTALTAVQRIDDSYVKTGSRGSMTFTVVVTDFRDERTTELQASARSTSITLEQPPSGGAGSGTPGPPAQDPLAVVTESPLTVTDFVRYQGASGDFNPIHHDTEFAQAAGYPGPIAVGMLTAGIAAAVLTRDQDPATLRRFSARWKSPAQRGDALTYAVLPGSDGVREARVTRPTGDVHLLARAEFDRG